MNEYFKFIYNNQYLSVNHKIKTDTFSGFSKNHFIKTGKELDQYINAHKDKDCYCTYNNLEKPINRKNDNVFAITIAAFDIELVKKSKPEDLLSLSTLENHINNLIKIYNITTYLLCHSGNGFHLYVKISPDIKISKENFNEVKKGYKTFIEEINSKLLKISDNFATCDDRKDLAGILRIPGTTNTSCDREVRIVDLIEGKPNIKVKNLLMKFIKEAKIEKEAKKVYKHREEDVNLPNSIMELEEHPVVKLIFDDSLPDFEGWHQNAIFLLQAIVKESGIPYYPHIKALEDDINEYWGTSMSLNYCSCDSIIGPTLSCVKWLRKQNDPKCNEYANKIYNTINNNK